LRTIGQSLNATHLIEGPVRKAGDRVRITVQLIKAEDRTHIWAENYDRQLTTSSDTGKHCTRNHDQLAHAARAESPAKTWSKPDIDPESYQQFLRARALYQVRQISSAGTTLPHCWNKLSPAIPIMRPHANEPFLGTRPEFQNRARGVSCVVGLSIHLSRHAIAWPAKSYISAVGSNDAGADRSIYFEQRDRDGSA